MANNEYVNKVLFGDTIVMDISDTTAEEGDVIEGQIFYTRSGAPATGSLGDATTSAHGLMSVSDKIKLDNIDEIQVYETIDTTADVMDFSNGASDVPMALKVGIEPAQDLHGYDNPWPAGGGKNLFDGTKIDGYISDDGTVGTDGTNAHSDYIKVTPGQTYTYSWETIVTSNVNRRIHGYQSDKSWSQMIEKNATIGNGSKTFTVPSGVEYIRIQFLKSDSDYDIQIESGSSASDYAPYENICPISGWTGCNVTRTGKNLFDSVSMLYRDNSGIDDDGVITSNENYKAYKMVLPSGEYVWSGTTSATGTNQTFRAITFNSNDEKIDLFKITAGFGRTEQAFTVTEETAYVLFSIRKTYSEMQVENGSNASAYEAYQGNTYAITFPSSAGTVYGGTLTINKDGTGELVVDKGSVDLGTLDWSASSDGVSFISDTAVSGIKIPSNQNNIAEVMCSNYKAYRSRDMANATVGVATSGKIKVRDDFFGLNTANFKTAMNGVMLVYQLATIPAPVPLTAPQVRSLLGINNIWADTGKINEVEYAHEAAGLINTKDKIKLDSLSTVAISGDYDDLSNKPDLSGYITSVPTMTGATSSTNGTAGLIPAPTTTDAEKFFRGDGTWQDGGRPMVILSYGNSTWNDFIEAYNNNVIVYTRASSNSNPASGSQTRMAFMAYVNNAATPTEVEFQYYRSVSSHSATQQGDQVFVYKLTKTSGWSVITRQASSKIVAGNNMSVTYSTDTLTVASTLESKAAAASGIDVSLVTTGEKAIWNNKADIADIPTATSDLTNDSGYLDPSDIANDLNTTEAGKVLDARQGKVLDEKKIDKTYENPDDFTQKTWTGLSSLPGCYIWTDGENIYYSSGTTQYILDKSTSTWSQKTWITLTRFDGAYVWSDGENIYYSYGTNHYILDKSTSTWSKKKWYGLTNFNGVYIWKDGESIYYSNGSMQYVLNKSTSTWSQKIWTGLTDFYGNNIWSDGENIYYNSSTKYYILTKSTADWIQKTWIGLTSFSGNNIWTDGENIYYSKGTNQYVLDKSTSTWSPKIWTGLTNFDGEYIWTDGENIYHNTASSSHVYNKKRDYVLLGSNGEFNSITLDSFISMIEDKITSASGVSF